MKKLLLVFAISTLFVACDSADTTTDVTTDTTTTTTTEESVITPADTTTLPVNDSLNVNDSL